MNVPVSRLIMNVPVSDYLCGLPPACTAVIPGCDCGSDANFVPGAGCVEDPGCP